METIRNPFKNKKPKILVVDDLDVNLTLIKAPFNRS